MIFKKKCLDGVDGISPLLYSTMKEWAKQFCKIEIPSKMILIKERPLEKLTLENIALVQEEISSDRKLKVKKVTALLNLFKTIV